MRPMRSVWLSLRFIVPLGAALAVLAYAVVPLVDDLTLRWFVRDIDMRSRLVATTLQDRLGELLRKGDEGGVHALMTRAIRDERLLAVGYCDAEGLPRYRTTTYPDAITCPPAGEAHQADGSTTVRALPEGKVHVALFPLDAGTGKAGSLILIHDLSFIDRRSAETREYLVILFAVLGVLTSIIAVLVAHLSWRGWVSGVRALLRGEGLLRPFRGRSPRSDFEPLLGDLRNLLRTLDEERRFADDTTVNWSPEKLRGLFHKHLFGERLLVVSNREPYIHVREGETLKMLRPASGLVTAVEPVMRACSGTWIAHGSGSGDRETVDRNDRVAVPPEHPEYSLRRIWLSAEEERGYYYGFANEGLWPLCHIAHVRPVFRTRDWEHYVAVNRRFAEAVVQEADSDDPVVLVQDYHFALLPQMIRDALPRATIITFWHIPWPNPESFGICPWRNELLEGLLGSAILGFHTRFHRMNFLETVDRYLETRIEHETSTISRGGHLTLVESYPISVQWPPAWQQTQPSIAHCRAEVRGALGVAPDHLIGIGVDREDYTKGILERFRAVEALLERHPELIGRFTFIEIAAPTRSALDDYRRFETQVRDVTQEINRRFATESWEPICLKARHHEPEVINRYFRASDVCVVTSLHDGMNLVAKEFVSARDDDRGVLVLSRFTGAAHELHEALIVNPYHIEQTADALYRALTMPEGEQEMRMRSMRSLVRDFNVYRWAGRMLVDAARIRQRQALARRIAQEP